MGSAHLVFGLDGGGSSSRLRIAGSSNELVWEGRGEGVNPNAVAPAALAERLGSLFSAAYAAAEIGARDFAAGCLGIAGSDRSGERAELEGLLRSSLGIACPLVLCADPDIALVGALRAPEGLILIAGTGSIALARLASGDRFRAGGHGHFLSDEGSAFALAFQAIRRCLRSLEDRDLPTRMLPGLLARFGLEEPSQFIPFIYRSFDKARIAGAADLVVAAAAEGDELARAIMDEAREELLTLVDSVYSRVRGVLANKELALWGGLIENQAALRAELVASLAERHPELVPVAPRESAAYGACALALLAAGGRQA